ncbi:MAG: immunoglobulin-like domain-containing protein [Flavobacteriaceae bacterium]
MACEPELSTENVSRTTYFTELELIGDEITMVPVGSTYVDEGVIATEGEEDVTDNVKVNSNVDASKIGYYTVTYSATNTDGFEKTISRIVLVHPVEDSGVDYSGTYTGVARGETIADGCVITKLGPSTYVASDFFGGVYCCGVRNYGLAYRLQTFFYVSTDNTTYTNMENTSPWGPWNLLNATLDGTTFSHAVEQGGFSFGVTLTKQ